MRWWTALFAVQLLALWFLLFSTPSMPPLAQVPNLGGNQVPNTPPSPFIMSGAATVGQCLQISSVGPPIVVVSAACGGGGNVTWSGSANLFNCPFIQSVGPPVGLADSGAICLTGPPTCTQAAQYLNRTTGYTGTDAAQFVAFICGGVTDGWWAKMDAVYIFATTSTGNALLNLVSSSFTASTVGGVTFTVNAGYNVTRLSTQQIVLFNSSSAGGLYTQNSAHVSSCSIETGGDGSGYVNGILGSVIGQNIFPKFSDNNTYIRVNDNPESGGIANAGTSTGHYLGSRTANNNVDRYKNGVSIGSDAQASQAVGNANWANGTGVSGSPYDGLVMAYTVGGALTSTDVSNLYTRLNTLLTARHGSSC